jgi:hypothetical protein
MPSGVAEDRVFLRQLLPDSMGPQPDGSGLDGYRQSLERLADKGDAH